MASGLFMKASQVFATHQSIDLSLDVYIPLKSTPANSARPVLLWFHGGYLITGSRIAIPKWLLNDAISRGWIVVSPDYRVLPESNGFAIIEDLQSAYKWTVNSLNTVYPESNADVNQIILAGASAGGWCAVMTAVLSVASSGSEQCVPLPKALFLLYPMLDLGSEKWSNSVFLPDSYVDPTVKKHLLEEIPRRIKEQEISAGEDFPASEEELLTRKRLPLLYSVLEKGCMLDYLTGIPGFAERRMANGLNVSLEQAPSLKALFPLQYSAFSNPFPASVIVHGTADREVSCCESKALFERLQAAGTSVQYFPESNADHTFDLGWEKPNKTLELALSALKEHLTKQVFQNVYDSLKSGGYIELCEAEFTLQSDDDSVPKEISNMFTLIRYATSATGRDMEKAIKYVPWLKEVGFVDINDKVVKWPMTPWAKHPIHKQVGQMQLSNFPKVWMDMEKLFEYAKIDKARAEEVKTQGLAALQNPACHPWIACHFIRARKPLENEK